MRNGQTPIHIQRWAPADYYSDEHVRLLILERDWATLTFYRHFIDASFAAGGDLPAGTSRPLREALAEDSSVLRALSACVWMAVRDISRPLSRILGVLIFQDGDRLYQPRVRRDVAREIEFRESQAAHGRRGGRPPSERLPLETEKGMVLQAKTPPAPTPAPVPTPAPTPRKTPAEEEFALLWKACRRKAAPEDARKAYAKLRKAGSIPPVDQVIAALEKLQASEDWARDGRKYQPYLATWLNRGGWEEEPRESGGNGSRSGIQPSFDMHPETKAALERRRKADLEFSRQQMQEPDPASHH